MGQDINYGYYCQKKSRLEVITHKNCFRGPQFRATRGMTQGVLELPTIFNVEVEIVVHHWLSLTLEDDSATHDRLGMVVGRCKGVFYVDDGMIGSRDP